ncbi:MAG: CoA transferase [Betaproteobacteria bacterium]|nr:CoA transferase [Betaproteobacteria bacterium]
MLDTPCRLTGTGTASDYANVLLSTLAATVERSDAPTDAHPAIAWANCGLMALTGNASGNAQMCPVPLASCADGVIKAISAIAGSDSLRLPRSGAALLGERAAIAGLQRQGSASPGGSCRLLRCTDGWLALNLARTEDWTLLPAWLEIDIEASWDTVAAAAAERKSMPLVERGRLMGLALAPADPPAVRSPAWFKIHHAGAAVVRHTATPPLVVDLSALWAGPLCAHLLLALGARVIKVESWERPDGARKGPQAFNDLLNAGKQSLALDFSSNADRAKLRELLLRADIVIEGSRPRALRQLGIVAEEMLAARPGLSWVSISGYGRGEPEANWAAYGDDAAVAAGLSSLLLEPTGEALICGDAIADPLTGMHAALAAWASYRAGGGNLLIFSLRDIVAHCMGFSCLPQLRNGARAGCRGAPSCKKRASARSGHRRATPRGRRGRWEPTRQPSLKNSAFHADPERRNRFQHNRRSAHSERSGDRHRSASASAYWRGCG